MNCISRKLQLILVSTLFALPLPLFAAAGKVVIAAGDVFAVNAQDERRQLQRRSDIFEGDTLVTGADGRLQLRFEDNAILALRANSQLRISEYHGATDDQNERVLMDLLGGGFRTISGSFGKSDRDAYQVRTPNASIGIRGTHYEAVFESETLSVGVYDGGIVLTNDQGSLNLGLDSEFVFAQVQAGNLPQGLLNPPANLNVPNTPQTDDDGEESDEEGTDEEGSDEANEDDSDLNNDTSSQSPDNNTNDNFATDVGNFSTDDFNFSALEDALEEEFANLNQSTVELTEDEIAALADEDTVQTGILVFAPSSTGSNGQPISSNGPLFGYMAGYGGSREEPEANQTFFVAYDSQNLTELDNGFTAPNLVVRPEAADTSNNGFFGETNFWGQWNAGNETTAVTAGETSAFESTVVDQPFYFITAEPTTAQLVGGRTFSVCNGCFAASGMNFDFARVNYL